MHEATIIDITTRHRALHSAHPEDATILSLCATFDGLERKRQALFDAIPDDDERELALDAIEVKQEPLVDRLAAMRATTTEEHQARARAVALYMGMQLVEDLASDLWCNKLLAAVVRDLAELDI